MFNEQNVLSYNPFEGDETRVRLLSDKIVVAAKLHPRCQICEGPILRGERHRCRVEKNEEDGILMSFRFCNSCCVAIDEADEGYGRLLDARYALGYLMREEARSTTCVT